MLGSGLMPEALTPTWAPRTLAIVLGAALATISARARAQPRTCRFAGDPVRVGVPGQYSGVGEAVSAGGRTLAIPYVERDRDGGTLRARLALVPFAPNARTAPALVATLGRMRVASPVPAVARAGAGVIAALWGEPETSNGPTQVRLTAFAATGAEQGGPTAVTRPRDGVPTLALRSAGTDLAAVWLTGPVPIQAGVMSPRLWLARIASDGRILDPPAAMALPRGGGSGALALVALPSGLGLAWDSAEESRARPRVAFGRLDGRGNLEGSSVHVAPPGWPSPVAAHSARMGWSGADFGVTWQRSEPDHVTSDLWFSRIDAASRRVVLERPIASNLRYGSTAPVGWTGTAYAVAWVETRADGQGRAMLAVLGPSGQAPVEPRTIVGNDALDVVSLTPLDRGMIVLVRARVPDGEVLIARELVCGSN